MIAADTSSLIAFIQGNSGKDISLLKNAIQDCQLILPPPVVSEILSDPLLPKKISDVIIALPLLELQIGFWQRVGKLRAKLIQKKLKARLADAMIAQSCLDHRVLLLTRDQDFRNFTKFSHLKIVLG